MTRHRGFYHLFTSEIASNFYSLFYKSRQLPLMEYLQKLSRLRMHLYFHSSDPYFSLSGVFREVGQPVMEVQFKLVHGIANRWPEYFH